MDFIKCNICAFNESISKIEALVQQYLQHTLFNSTENSESRIINLKKKFYFINGILMHFISHNGPKVSKYYFSYIRYTFCKVRVLLQHKTVQ